MLHKVKCQLKFPLFAVDPLRDFLSVSTSTQPKQPNKSGFMRSGWTVTGAVNNKSPLNSNLKTIKTFITSYIAPKPIYATLDTCWEEFFFSPKGFQANHISWSSYHLYGQIQQAHETRWYKHQESFFSCAEAMLT